MKIITYSAPAKVILSGEHAVVYGRPALVCSINLRLKFSLWEKEEKIEDKNIILISQIVKKYLKETGIDFIDKKFNYQIESQIPVGQGLGSSAAFSVVTAAAFLKFYSSKNFSKNEINQVAYEIEKYFHQNPSGADNTTSCFGGLIYFRKEFDFLKNITILDFKLPKNLTDKLFLIDSGKAEEKTSEMVMMVKKNYQENPNFFNQVFFDIEKVTKTMVLAIKNQDIDLFAKCILDNEIFLEILGVVSKKTKNLLKRLEKFGIGKITGAGGKNKGSGFLLFLAKKKDALIKFLQKEKINYFKFQPDWEGLK